MASHRTYDSARQTGAQSPRHKHSFHPGAMPKAIRSTRKATPRVNKTVSLKVDEARELDRAARRDGLEFSTWARATLLDRARNPKEAA